MCMYCKNTTTIKSKTTHIVNYNNCVIIVKNVTCLECEQYGEKYYTEEVAERLLENIVLGDGMYFISFLCIFRKK